MESPFYTRLHKQLAEIAHLNACLALLQWDQEIHMPVKGGEPRSKTISYLSVLVHEKILGLNEGKMLACLRKEAATHPTHASVVIREAWRTYEREQKLPAAFVQELSALCSLSQTAWAEARKTDDFSLFLPKLKRLVELKRQEAEYIGYKKSPYDALLDAYEPGLTSEHASNIFSELKAFLTPFVRSLAKSPYQPPKPNIAKGKFPIEEQRALNEFIAKKIGFNLEAGRLDVSTHPFTTSFHPHDVRLTTRYDETNLLYALGSTIHEVGHGLYEQGLPAEHFGTPLGESISLGIHESQSRIWENMIGKSQAFWQYFYPHIQKRFPKPFASIPLETFYRLINRVEPSLIRTEADEVTYNLHIIIRFEIEKGLIEGKLQVKDLPKIWNEKIKEYLCIKVPNNRLGVLQDVHWSMGAFGYFPTYALGNLYAAQLYHAAKEKLPTLDKDLKKGNLSPFREWLRTNIHAHGKCFTSEALIKQVSGEPLQVKYFTEYLQNKYRAIYG